MTERIDRKALSEKCYIIYEETVREGKDMTAKEVDQLMLRFEAAIKSAPVVDGGSVTPELKPCPFCGKNVILEHTGIRACQSKENGDLITGWKIRCSNCGTEKGPYNSEYRFCSDETLLLRDPRYGDGRAKVIEAWNRRAGDGK